MITATRRGELVIRGLPVDLLDFIKSGLTCPNPVFVEAERAERWTGGIEPELRFYRAVGDILIVPRGVGLKQICEAAGKPVELVDETTAPRAVLTFGGELRP